MMNPTRFELTPAQRTALERLLRIAHGDTGQSRRVADFLLAWHNAAENGGWDPTDLWSVDSQLARDMVTILDLLANGVRAYPPDFGYQSEIEAVWRIWRGQRTARPEKRPILEKEGRNTPVKPHSEQFQLPE